MLLKRVIIGLLLLVAAIFAVEGGEYGTSDLVRQRRAKERLQSRIGTLRSEIDSLSRVRKAVLSDPATQERIAREEFGMIRGEREILYRLLPPDSVTDETRSASGSTVRVMGGAVERRP